LIYFQYTLQNYSLTDAVQQISESYKCKPIEGMLSHELKQFKIDGEKTIIQNPSEAQRKEHEKCTFETYEVYAIDVIVSSGEGVVSNPSKIPIFSTLCSMIKNKRLRLTWLECGVCCESVLYARRVYVLETLKAVIGLCVVDASVREICTQGDNQLTEETGKVSGHLVVLISRSFVQ